MTNTLTGPNESLPLKQGTDLRCEEGYFQCENLTWDISPLCILTLMYILKKRSTAYTKSRTHFGRGCFK